MSIHEDEHIEQQILSEIEEAAEDVGTSHATSTGETYEKVWERRFTRRTFVKGAAAAAPLFVVRPESLAQGAAANVALDAEDTLTFEPIDPRPRDEDAVVVPEGYIWSVLSRWGDPINENAPSFDPDAQTPDKQAQQVGYNCDYVGFFPLGAAAFQMNSLQAAQRGQLGLEGFSISYDTDEGILVTNHEYTNPELMFRNYRFGAPTRDQVEVEIEAHGLSIFEIRRRSDNTWEHVVASNFNRRLTGTTPMEITGPAAGDDLLKTDEDPTGTRVRGTLNNCAGGKTPWGTVLTCEENFHQYFGNNDNLPEGDPQRVLNARFGTPGGSSFRRWEEFDDRFDVSKNRNEINRFGYVVEIDPYDPTFVPKKRTALGRVKHEGATTFLADDGRVVVYTGDDERFDYVYKFVTAGRYDPANREANFGLLDEGMLYVAKFDDDGTGEWIPLVWGQGPLTPENGFASQAEVLIKTRLAADAVGATRMDRPEDIQPNPVTGKIYVTLTNNSRRQPNDTDAANPRGPNFFGHILEVTETNDDHAGTTFGWEIFLLCGDPSEPSHGTFFAGFDKSQVSPISAPDNIVFDIEGNLWIGTDGNQTLGHNDGLFACPTQGKKRGFLRQFSSIVAGSENCGPEFTLDGKTAFTAVQHPGQGGNFENPASLFPDNRTPPRPTVITIAKKDGGRVGS
jgi:hypothetical protein